MYETILNLIIEQWPFLALLIVAIIATFVIVWHFSKWYHRFEKVEEKVDDLPCDKHDDLYRRFVNTEEKVKELPCSKHDEVFHDIKEQLVEIRAILIMKNPKVANAFSQKSSTRELNEAGLHCSEMLKEKNF